MSKFTKGPWVVSASWSPPNGGFSIHGGSDSYIADVYAGHHKDDEVTQEIGTANARLIAAAPELFNALAGMLKIHDSVTQGQEQELRDKWIPVARALLKSIDGE